MIEEVRVDCLVMDDGPHHDVDVPDSVSQGDDSCNIKYSHRLCFVFLPLKFTVRFEENDSDQVNSPASLELCQARLVSLNDISNEMFATKVQLVNTGFVLIIPFSML